MVENPRRTAEAVWRASVAIAVLTALLVGMPASVDRAGAQTAEASIHLLNPTPGTSSEASDQPDGMGGTYHLVAWVANPPADAAVGFELTPEDEPGFDLPPATRVGLDTWELEWSIPDDLPDGDYSLSAVLYANASNPLAATEVARDRHDMVINQHDPVRDAEDLVVPDPAAETVEIVYPANGGEFGVFTSPGQPGAGVLDVSFSQGTTYVRVFYTIDSPGTEPTWKVCGTSGVLRTSEPGRTLVRCTLATADAGSQVTAVAALANDTPQVPVCTPVGCANVNYDEDFEDSGDGHRVLPYTQIPTAVTLDPALQQVAAAGDCTPVYTAKVVDQQGTPIAGANVDVHAQGPTDRLTFDTDVNPSDPNQAPDKNHGGSESAYNCQNDDFGGTQGDHNVPIVADIKHIETRAPGTSNAGEFRFRLRSDSPGETQITAWADADDDDEFCSAEANGDAMALWVTPAIEPVPVPIGVAPDEAICGQRGLTLTPNEAKNKVGTQHVFTATVSAAGQPVVGAPITWDTSGVGTIVSAETTTDENGRAQAIVSSSAPGDQRLRASTTCSDEEDPGDCRDTSIKHWGPKRCDVYGTNGDDNLKGSRAGETICGFGGDDVLEGAGSGDRLLGGKGRDALRGQAGSDKIVGAGGNDHLQGNSGNDVLKGGPGRDRLEGGKGSDRCDGGSGNDSAAGCEG